MSIQDRFLQYADAFEISYDDNDWSRLAQYFTAEAIYDSGDGEAAHGRDAVLAKLEGAVDGLDRLMDSREVGFSSPATEADTVSVHWTAHYRKAGLPNLEFGGNEYARFESDRIAHLWDEFDAGAVEAIGAWLGAHGGELSN
jgi:hypothetical protein